jgi:hypothetical protein
MTASVSRKVRLCSMRFSPTIRNCTRLIPPHRSNHSCSPCEPESRIETPGAIMRSHSSSVALCVCEHNPGWMCLPLCAALESPPVCIARLFSAIAAPISPRHLWVPTIPSRNIRRRTSCTLSAAFFSLASICTRTQSETKRQRESLTQSTVVTCMVRRPNARRIGLDEKQSAKMYPASSGEWSPGA